MSLPTRQLRSCVFGRGMPISSCISEGSGRGLMRKIYQQVGEQQEKSKNCYDNQVRVHKQQANK